MLTSHAQGDLLSADAIKLIADRSKTIMLSAATSAGVDQATVTLDDLRQSSAPTLTMKLAGQVLGVDARTVSTGIKEGNIPAIRIGRRVVIPRERFLALFSTDTPEKK